MKYRIIGPDDPALTVLQTQLKSHPEWETELTIIPWVEYQSLMMESLTAPISNYHAVCVPGHIWLPGLIESGYLVDFESIISDIPHQLVDTYQPSDIVSSIQIESRHNGKQYMLPLFSDGHIIFYRKDLFPHLYNDQLPIINAMHIDKVLDKAKITEGMFPFALKAHASEILTDWLPYFWSAGAEMTNEDGLPVFNSPEAIHSLEYYRGLKRFCPPDTDQFGNAEISALLKKGKIAMAVTWGGQAASVMNESNPYCDLLGTAIFENPWNATWGICIPANLPREYQTGVLSVLFASADPQQDRMVTKIAGSPVRKSSYQKEEISKYPWLEAQKKMLDRCKILPAKAEFSKFIGPLYAAVYSSFTEKMTSVEALNQAILQ